MTNRIMFNGEEMPERVYVQSCTLSTPTVNVRTVDAPGRRGLTRAGKKIGNRTVQMDVVAWGDNLEDTADIVRELYVWAMSDEPKQLRLPGYPGGYFLAECDTFPPFNLADIAAPMQIAFTLSMPDFFEDRWRSEAVGTPFKVGGTLDVFPRIEWEVPTAVDSPAWIIDDVLQIRLDGSVDAGLLVIDCELEKVALDGDDITAMATLDSTIGFTLKPGVHTIAPNNGAGGTVYWRNSWL